MDGDTDVFFLFSSPRQVPDSVREDVRRQLLDARDLAPGGFDARAEEFGLTAEAIRTIERGGAPVDVGSLVAWAWAAGREPGGILREAIRRIPGIGSLDPGTPPRSSTSLLSPPSQAPSLPVPAHEPGHDRTRLHRVLGDAWRAELALDDGTGAAAMLRHLGTDHHVARCVGGARSTARLLAGVAAGWSVAGPPPRVLWVARRRRALDAALSALAELDPPLTAGLLDPARTRPVVDVLVAATPAIARALSAGDPSLASPRLVLLDGLEPAEAPGVQALLAQGAQSATAFSVLDGPPPGERGSSAWMTEGPIAADLQSGAYAPLRWEVLPDDVVPGAIARTNLGWDPGALSAALTSATRMTSLFAQMDARPDGQRLILVPTRPVGEAVRMELAQRGEQVRIAQSGEGWDEPVGVGRNRTLILLRPPTRWDVLGRVSEIVVLGPTPIRGLARGLLCAMRSCVGGPGPWLRWMWGGTNEVAEVAPLAKALGGLGR